MGTATSLALAEAGAQVVAVDYVADRLEDTEARLAAIGASCVPLLADVTDRDAVNQVVQTAAAKTGRIDYLVNVAGGTQPGDSCRLEDYPEDLYDQVMALNLNYVLVAAREAAKYMIRQGSGGGIVNFSSVNALRAAPFHAAYGAAKAAVISLTRTMAVEWGQYGIRVNAIVPGNVATPRSTPLRKGGYELSNPIPRLANPEELASVVLVLLSDLTSMVTGQAWVIDGGMTAHSPAGRLERWEKRLWDDEQERQRHGSK